MSAKSTHDCSHPPSFFIREGGYTFPVTPLLIELEDPHGTNVSGAGVVQHREVFCAQRVLKLVLCC